MLGCCKVGSWLCGQGRLEDRHITPLLVECHSQQSSLLSSTSFPHSVFSVFFTCFSLLLIKIMVLFSILTIFSNLTAARILWSSCPTAPLVTELVLLRKKEKVVEILGFSNHRCVDVTTAASLCHLFSSHQYICSHSPST